MSILDLKKFRALRRQYFSKLVRSGKFGCKDHPSLVDGVHVTPDNGLALRLWHSRIFSERCCRSSCPCSSSCALPSVIDFAACRLAQVVSGIRLQDDGWLDCRRELH
uniref:(northern house mosquito) hypothetical protein n=1 Tax=Culex pipiens TaxID=7175 RepID=A0A8D8P6G1_CULPI